MSLTRLAAVGTAAGAAAIISWLAAGEPLDDGAAVGLIVYGAILMTAGAPYWLARASERSGWRAELLTALPVAGLVVLQWVWVAWDGDGLLPTPASDVDLFLGLDPFLIFAIVLPYLLLGLLWGARAVFPALCALLLVGGIDTSINDVATHPIPALTPYEGAAVLGVIAAPFMLFGALGRAIRKRTRRPPRVPSPTGAG